MKFLDKTNPDPWRKDHSPAQSAEPFLDFDPVFPSESKGQSEELSTRCDSTDTGGHDMTVHSPIRARGDS